MTNPARARAMVLRDGWNTTCFQIVNPCLQHWFSPSGDAVVGYVRRAGVRVVAGAPVCAEGRLPEVLAEFEGAERGGVCYFGAEDRLYDRLHGRPDYATVALGAQPVWSPDRYLQAFAGDRSLRAQRNRAANKGVAVREWPADRVRNHPELRRVLGEWLGTRGLPPLHFLVEPETLGYPEGRRVFVAEREGVPVGFVTLCPAPARNAWLTEQFVRGRGAPNGTIELALLAAVEAIARDGAAMVTMGIVPLAGDPERFGAENPAWLRLLSRWAKAHGRRFYDFDGLEWFKEKFHPEAWEPVYAISKESRFSVRTLWAVAGAFSDGSPALALAKGLGRAVVTEIKSRSDL